MPETFAVAIRACGVALAMMWMTAWAAEPASPLMGATRQQVISRLGEPRSQIERGQEIIFLYARERVVFRGAVVVEVEQLIPDVVRRPPAETPPPAQPTTPDTPTAAVPPTPGAATPAPTDQAKATPPSPSGETKLEIKRVRGPLDKDDPPVVAAPKVTPPSEEPKPAPVVVAPPPEPKAPVKDEATLKAERDAIEARNRAEREASVEKEKQAKAVREARRRLDQAADAATAPAPSSGNNLVWIVIGGVVAAGIGFMIWRSKRIEIAPNRSSKAAGVAPLASVSSTRVPAGNLAFTAEYLAGLEWKRFESLVATYYSKTGVVAERTNSGPEKPVHIKISWKGEPQPFAYVQCIAHPSGQVDAKPLKDLVGAMAADNIRRGYVVTSGQFNNAARDLAAQKQITLLPIDVFLEKLNALPLAARKEIMQESNVVG